MKLCIIALSLLLIFSCRSPLITKSELAQLYFEIGTLHLNNSESQAAENYLLKTLDLDSELFRGQYNLSVALMKQESYAQALSILEILLEEEPHSPRLLKAKAYALYKISSLEDSWKIYQFLLKQYPYDPDLLLNASILSYEQEEFERTLGLLKTYVTYVSYSPVILQLYEQVAQKTDNLALRIQSLEELLLLDYSSRWLDELVSLYAQQEEPDKILSLYEGLIPKIPVYDKALLEIRKVILYTNTYRDIPKAFFTLRKIRQLSLSAGQKQALRTILDEQELLQKTVVFNFIEEEGIFHTQETNSPQDS